MRLKLLAINLLFSGFYAFSQVPTNGLTHAYTFNEGNALDEVGSVNGTVVGATLDSDRFGNPHNAYYFNGSSSYISFGRANTFLPTTGTISLWAKREGNGSNTANLSYDPILVAHNLSTSGYFEGAAIVAHRSNGSWLTVTTKSQNEKVISKSNVSTNAWHHTVMAFSNDSLYFYIDGQLSGKIAKGFVTELSTTVNVMLGYSGSTTYRSYFKGSIDDLRIYNRVLSVSEVQELYNEVVSDDCITETVFTHPNLTHFYSFNCGNTDDLAGEMDGTASGAVALIEDRFGNPNNAYNLNGVNASINLGNGNDLMPVDGSVSMWVKRTGTAATSSNMNYDPFFIAKNNSLGGYFEAAAMGVSRSNGSWIAVTTVNTSEKVVVASGISANEWHHVVMAYDTDSLRYYIDGAQVGRVAKGFASVFSAKDVYLGYTGESNYLSYFQGGIDDVMIFNKVLSRAEVLALYEAENPLITSLPVAETKETSAYPNPTGSVIYFEGNGELFDVMGNRLSSANGSFDLSGYSSGVYILKSANNTQRIIKE